MLPPREVKHQRNKLQGFKSNLRLDVLPVTRPTGGIIGTFDRMPFHALKATAGSVRKDRGIGINSWCGRASTGNKCTQDDCQKNCSRAASTIGV